MKKKNKLFLTRHSKVRFEERTEFSNTALLQKAVSAFKYGHEFAEFKDPFSTYLKSISYENGKYVAKAYENYIYIFNNANGHRLLTVYNLPEEYLPIEQYLIPDEELCRCLILLIHKKTKKTYFWDEFGGLAENVEEALKFNNQIKARNYINNNLELDDYKDNYNIELKYNIED